MSRLFFAAARGARIEKTRLDGKFRPTCEVPLWDIDESVYSWRIHPGDEHLQYGPISTVLRKFAAGNVSRPKDDTHWRIARDCYIHATGAGFYTLEEPSLFLLILAEALADEGL